MRAQQSIRLVRGGALFALVAASCGNDEATGARSPAGNSGSCVACAGDSSGGDGSSGGSTSDAGEGGTPVAMAGKSPLGGSTSGTGGRGGTDNTPGGEGGSAGEPPDGLVKEQLALCDRLSMVSQESTTFTKAFEKLVYADCRVNWLNHLYLDFKPNKRDDYLNALIPWNLQFWGCPGSNPVGDFPLVFEKAPLSQGDADIVVGYYVQAAISELGLTKQEQAEMKTALEHLATTVIVSDSSEPSKPMCDEPGGAGGMGGMDGLGGADGLGGSGGSGGTDSLGGTGIGGAP